MATSTRSVHDFVLPAITGGDIVLKDFAGKALLLVNTASGCGFTPQYEGLETLAQTHAANLALVGVPSNDFGGQEPGDETQIKQFCDLRFHITFPLAAKQHVIGAEAHPLYKWIASDVGYIGRPHWNFYKYVFDRQGRLVDWFSSITKPDSARLMVAVEKALQ